MDNYPKATTAEKVTGFSASDLDRQSRLNRERMSFGQCMRLHELPAIFHYWSNVHLARQKFQPFGITGIEQFFYLYVQKYHERKPGRNIQLASLGTGSVEMESRLARKLLDNNISTFSIDCIDVTAAASKGALEYSVGADVNQCVFAHAGGISNWLPEKQYDIVLANQSLHHVLELEYLLGIVSATLVDEGHFLVSDTIGKNGLQLWPEALGIIEEFWKQLPARYKYNHVLKRLELRYANHDYSIGAREGVRSQDLLPLLNALFKFELFIPFSNLIPVFIERQFGYNFNADSEWDQDFIDRVHERDEQGILSGELKPAQMLAALCMNPVEARLVDPRLTPEFCVRHTSYM